MKATINNVTLRGGKVVNQESKRLNVEIPAGMTGAQLLRWKKDNEGSICSALQQDEPEDSSEDVGDSNASGGA